MKNKKELALDAKGYFENYPHIKEIHATSDGQFFLNSNDANTHASLKGFEKFTILKGDLDIENKQPQGEPLVVSDPSAGEKEPGEGENPSPATPEVVNSDQLSVQSSEFRVQADATKKNNPKLKTDN